MTEIIIAFMAGVVMGIGVTRGKTESCPRELVGHPHRVNDCDHSDEAFAEAYKVLNQRKDKK